jgi:hypothetical protein
MAKKIFIVSTVLVLALSGLAFANGQKDSTVPAASEKVTLTGNVYLEGELHPLLKSGGKEYELMVPPYLVTQIDIKEGAEIKVEGYTVPGMGWRWQAEDADADIEIMVTKATVNGKEYDLSEYAGPMGGRGGMMDGRAAQGRGGMMGGRGGMMGGRGGMTPRGAWGPRA